MKDENVAAIGSADISIDDKKKQSLIFVLLRSVGPLCPSQISVELGLSLKEVEVALKALQKRGIVDLRPDRDMTKQGDEAAWGLAVSFRKSA
jgi:Mn-dependent DtxR family transcriptional regulator